MAENVTPNIDWSMSQLKAEAVRLGMPEEELKKFTSKGTLLAAIQAIAGTTPSTESDTVPGSTPNGAESEPSDEGDDEDGEPEAPIKPEAQKGSVINATVHPATALLKAAKELMALLEQNKQVVGSDIALRELATCISNTQSTLEALNRAILADQ